MTTTWNDVATYEVMVGDSTCKVTEEEYLAATAPKGAQCWFRYRKKKPFSSKADTKLSAWTRGTLRFTWFYDGVMIEVFEDDPDDLIKHCLVPSLYWNDPERAERFRLTDPAQDNEVAEASDDSVL